MPCDPDQASLVRLSTALASVGRLGFTVSEGAQTPCLRVTCKRSSALGLPLGVWLGSSALGCEGDWPGQSGVF